MADSTRGASVDYGVEWGGEDSDCVCDCRVVARHLGEDGVPGEGCGQCVCYAAVGVYGCGESSGSVSAEHRFLSMAEDTGVFRMIYLHSYAQFLKAGRTKEELMDILRVVCLVYLPEWVGRWVTVKEWQDLLTVHMLDLCSFFRVVGMKREGSAGQCGGWQVGWVAGRVGGR